GFQDLLRASAKSLAAIAVAGRADAAVALLDAGIPARDPARSPIALAFGTVAIRNTPLSVKILAGRSDLRDSALLLRDQLAMLEADFNAADFFDTAPHTY